VQAALDPEVQSNAATKAEHLIVSFHSSRSALVLQPGPVALAL